MQQTSNASNCVQSSNSQANSATTQKNELKNEFSNNSRSIQEPNNQSIIATVVNALIVGLLLAAGGAIAAWALTSISPIAGAIMAGTFTATFILILDILPEEYKGLSFVAAAIATNLVVYGAFPYLGLEAISWVTVTIFSAVTTMTGAVIASAFHSEKKLELDSSYLSKKTTTASFEDQHHDAFNGLVNTFMN